MSKISANGASEVARITAINPRTTPPSKTIMVLCSDGRILTRYAGDAGTGYTVAQRHASTTNGDLPLRRLAARYGLTVK